ncbi:hypothetical protein MHYP_G00342820 [Metynnis hypsauchen]
MLIVCDKLAFIVKAMSQSAKLRVILEDHDIRKLTLPLGIPSTVEELVSNVQDTFSLKGDFCLQYKDPDFDGQFVTLTTTEDVKDFKDRWPALFSESQIKDEFMRITTVNLERTFMTNLDAHMPKLLDLLKGKGGSAGTKIRPLLDSLAKNNDLDHRRDLVIRGLISYLGENGEDLLKDYQDMNEDDLSDSYINHVLKIIVRRQRVGVLTHVSIVIEGTEVLADCKTVAKACTLLMGLMYALHFKLSIQIEVHF